MISDAGVSVLVVVCVAIGFGFALINFLATRAVKVDALSGPGEASASDNLLVHAVQGSVAEKVRKIAGKISTGANAFLFREYVYIGIFLVGFTFVLLLVLGLSTKDWPRTGLTIFSFILGASTSVASGYAGMWIATYANQRTCIRAAHSVGAAFNVAFKAGLVMGFFLVSAAIIMLYILMQICKGYYTAAMTVGGAEQTRAMFEAIAGYGLGGSTVALFGRVGGGIYTKAADVGADLVGKLENGMPEDDPRNPAVVADNVGDNVGDIAGMGADLFGSFAESACATMVVASNSVGPNGLSLSWAALSFPLALASTGLLVSMVTSFVATHLWQVRDVHGIEPSLKRQIGLSTLIMTPVAFIVCYYFLPNDGTFVIGTDAAAKNVKYWYVFFCVACGLWSGMAIGYITEYYTSHGWENGPVREVAEACKTGAATNIIFGIALGYKSVIIPVFCLAVTIYVSYSLAGMFGIAVAALGILSTLPTSLTIDAYGPICDNAGGIAEMAGMDKGVRERTDALDAAGNTTAAIGKGFAIGSAALVSLALFGAYVTIVGLDAQGVNLLKPFEFAGLLVGAMLPYWFSAMTMKSVGLAANGMVIEVRRQLREHPEIMAPNSEVEPDYERCIAISTDHSLREMMPPGALVMLTPIIVGFFFGTHALAGVLAGALVSGVQIAISSANMGGAWDNAKKYIEGKGLGENLGKHSAPHQAAVVGDTVGDPLKDTSGPSLNILIKLMAIISVVFGPALAKFDKGLLEQWFG